MTLLLRFGKREEKYAFNFVGRYMPAKAEQIPVFSIEIHVPLPATLHTPELHGLVGTGILVTVVIVGGNGGAMVETIVGGITTGVLTIVGGMLGGEEGEETGPVLVGGSGVLTGATVGKGVSTVLLPETTTPLLRTNWAETEGIVHSTKYKMAPRNGIKKKEDRIIMNFFYDTGDFEKNTKYENRKY